MAESNNKPDAYMESGGALEAHRAFVIDGQDRNLTAITTAPPETNRATMQVAFSFRGEKLIADAEMRLSGAFADQMKAGYQQRLTLRSEIIASFNRIFYKGEATDVTITPNIHSSEPFIATALLQFSDDIWTEANQKTLLYAGNLSTLLQLFTDLPQLTAAEDPIDEFRFNYDYRLKMTFSLSSPSDSYLPLIIDGDDQANSRYFSYARKIESGVDAVNVHLEFILHNPAVKAADYAGFRKALLDLQQRSLWQVVYTRDNRHQRTLELQRQVVQGGPDKVEGLLELVRHHLMLANFDQAREFANQAVIDYPNNAEAYYLLGIALGFLDDYPASESALSKADLLGYQP
ncbi:MAG: tetratricopeptide repeat protein [Chromatiales bacterium]